MNKNVLFSGVICLIIGLIVGFSVANSLNKSAALKQANPLDPNAQVMAQNGNPAIPNSANAPTGGMQADVQKTLDQAQNEPENYEIQLEAGRMYARIQNFDKALEFFQKAQKLKPDDFEANAFLGNAYLDARQFENAETFYTKALSIKPDNVTVRSDLAATYIERPTPDYDKAFEQFNKALEIDPKHEATIYNMAIAYLRKGDKENAQQTLSKLKETNPESDLIAKLQEIINKNR